MTFIPFKRVSLDRKMWRYKPRKLDVDVSDTSKGEIEVIYCSTCITFRGLGDALSQNKRDGGIGRISQNFALHQFGTSNEASR